MADIAVTLNEILWSNYLIVLCLAAGVLFTLRSRVLQIRMLPAIAKNMMSSERSTAGVSSFQALMVSLSSRVGTGNIAGVATAIAFGGPGALFWMWTVAVLGAATSFVECTLAQIYKEHDRDSGEYRGGPAYYVAKALRHTRASGLFSVYATVFAFTVMFSSSFLAPGIQANTIAVAVEGAWGVPAWVSATAIVIVLGFIIIGGIKRIATFAGYVVPAMALLYIIVAVIVVTINIAAVPEMLRLVFSSAFGSHAAFGAMLGAAVEWGVKRGIYSNEAGQGTGAIAAASAEVSHPAKQGLVQAGAIYIDTLFVCTATGFMILSTGMYRVYPGADETAAPVFDPGRLPAGVQAGPGYVQNAFDSFAPGLGSSFVAVAVIFFAFTTIVAFYYLAETNLKYLLRRLPHAGAREVLTRLLQLVFLIAVVYGSVSASGSAWALADVSVGLGMWLNLVAILILQGAAFKALRDYERQARAGLDPVFDPRGLGIVGAHFWEERAAAEVSVGSSTRGTSAGRRDGMSAGESERHRGQP